MGEANCKVPNKLFLGDQICIWKADKFVGCINKPTILSTPTWYTKLLLGLAS